MKDDFTHEPGGVCQGHLTSWIIPKHIVIHRITGDAPRDMLIGLCGASNKWEVLNAIETEMRRRGSTQGCKLEERRLPMLRPLEMAHQFLAEVITKEDVVVDATMGNGHDTAFFSSTSRPGLCL